MFNRYKKCRFCQQVGTLILVLFILLTIYLSTQLLPSWIEKSYQNKNSFSIQQANSVLEDYDFYINASLEMNFTPAVIAALANGVPLTITIELQVNQKNEWFDTLIKESMLQFELRYHALTDIYTIKNKSSKKEYHFNSREEAMELLGNISHAHLISLQQLDQSKHHQVSLRVFLDIWQLPDVLRPVASLSKDWQLRSQWYKWMLN
ncbi:MAG: DUF4390 domain-containing protein [Pseudomonadota bacterium]